MTMAGHAAALYERIRSNPEQTQALFRQALQDPSGAMASICQFGKDQGLPVTPDEVRQHLASLDDPATAGLIVEAGQMLPDLIRGDRESLVFSELADGGHGTGGILQRLPE